MKTVQEDVPRTVVKTETIQHPETVERTVMVDQAREVMQVCNSRCACQKCFMSEAFRDVSSSESVVPIWYSSVGK